MSKQKQEITECLAIKDPSKLLAVLKAMNTLADEANIKVTSDGVIIRSMDVDHISLSDIIISRDMFERYELEDIKFRVKLDEINKILARGSKDSVLLLYIKDGMLNITINADYAKSYQIGVMEFKTEEDKVPKLDLKRKLEVRTTRLKEMMEDLALVSDYMELEIKDNKVTLNGKGDVNRTSLDFFAGDKTIMTLLPCDDPEVEKKRIKLRFRFAKFDKYVGIMKAISETVTMEVDHQMPMKMDYQVENFGNLTLYIAPIFGEEDDNKN